MDDLVKRQEVFDIINQFDNVWLISWNNDCLDDIWFLKIGIQ